MNTSEQIENLLLLAQVQYERHVYPCTRTISPIGSLVQIGSEFEQQLQGPIHRSTCVHRESAGSSQHFRNGSDIVLASSPSPSLEIGATTFECSMSQLATEGERAPPASARCVPAKSCDTALHLFVCSLRQRGPVYFVHAAATVPLQGLYRIGNCV